MVARISYVSSRDSRNPPLCFDNKRSMLAPVEAIEVMRLSERISLPQGTLDLLILKTLALEPQHGWAISERIQQISGNTLQVQQGSLYPSLHRLERRGRIKARWGTSENGRRAKFYELTKAGRQELEKEAATWRRLSIAVIQVLDVC
jgi:PadR family transcriptional regulator PadR